MFSETTKAVVWLGQGNSGRGRGRGREVGLVSSVSFFLEIFSSKRDREYSRGEREKGGRERE